MTIPDSERVRVIKWESVAEGGGQNDEVPTGCKPTEDALEVRGYYGQPAGGPRDEDVAIYRDGDDWKFVDKTITDARTLEDVVSGGKVAAAQTTDDTVTQLYVLALPVSKAVQIEAVITCRNSTDTIFGSWMISASAHRGSSGDAILDMTLLFYEYNTASLYCDFTVSGNNIRLTITGLVSETINWVATLTTTPLV